YYYSNAEFDEDIENAVKNIFEATENYLYYLEKAGTPDYLPELVQNYEADRDAACGGDDWRDEETDLDDLFFAPENHIVMSIADGPMNEKAIKRLKKVGAKGNLDIIYEKRLLKYIEAGNKVDRKNIVDQEEFEKNYSRKYLIMDAIVFVSSFIFFAALYFVVHSIMFKGATVYPLTWNIFGKEMPLYLDKLVTFLFAAVMTTFEIHLLFGKRIMIKSMPKDMQNRVEDKYKKEDKDRYGKLEKPVKIIGGILIPFFIILFFVSEMDDIGYYDTYVRYNSSVAFETLDVNYEDLEIYKVKYVYDKNDEYVLTENAYAVSDGNGNYYDYGELEKYGKTETKLKEIAKNYNKEITEIESIDVLNERFMNDI
ncbi:MAG: hypothetical protein K2I73_00195, partial [Eubacterium sp.]|nr:hypothetical protein [Eubacterium sp.]